VVPKDWDKPKVKAKKEKFIDELDELQHVLFAEYKHLVLVIIKVKYGNAKRCISAD
jgi:hypothetical protein